MASSYSKIENSLKHAGNMRLFLDYDGTLAEFAPNPDIVEPKTQIIQLLELFINNKNIHTSIISGRRLSHLQKLVPLRGITLAGSYGLEIQMQNGSVFYPLKYADIRPQLNSLKTRWNTLLEGNDSFYLEDKGWTLAIHAKYAEITDCRKGAGISRECGKRNTR